MHRNTLYTGDNLYIMNGMNSESVDLVYTDPPFNSKRLYSAPIGSKAAGASFKDIWTWDDVDTAYMELAVNEYPYIVQYITAVQGIHSKAMASYLSYMFQRVIHIHRILKPTGSFYIHVDPTSSHYVKIICDRVFGKENFRNEIAWCYRGAGYPKNDFGRRHDVLLKYSKSKEYVFNLDDIREPYADATRERFKHYIGNVRKSGDFGQQSLNPLGKHPDDWWQIQPIAPSSKERTGFPTQKPLKLLHRIIKASSNEGDIVCDPFCGCATTLVAAQQLNRNWIGIDMELMSKDLIMERLQDDAGMFTDFIHLKKTPVRTDVKVVELSRKELVARIYREQKQSCNGCNNEYDVKDLELDHIVPQSKGGQNVYENYQLLCGHCNRTKGDRPMEYLLSKIAARQAATMKVSY